MTPSSLPPPKKKIGQLLDPNGLNPCPQSTLILTCINVIFFLLSEAGNEGVLRHHDEGVGETGVELEQDILMG